MVSSRASGLCEDTGPADMSGRKASGTVEKVTGRAGMPAPKRERNSRVAISRLANVASTSRMYSAPASVSVSLRIPRLNSRTPRSLSSDRTRALTAEGVMQSR